MSKTWVWVGWVMSGLFVLFMIGASLVPKFFIQQIAAENLTGLGWPPGYVLMIGTIELIGVVLYAIPRTSLLGAIWMTGLLGGAMATQIRAESPLLSHILFSVYLGIFMWGGLWLRDAAVRNLLPFKR